MKKKTIIFLCLAIAFLISIPSCFASSLTAGLLCIAFCGLFVFLAFRSAKPVAKTNNEIPQTQNRSTPPHPNKSSISRPLQDNTVNASMAETSVTMPVPTVHAPHIAEISPSMPPVSTSEDKAAVIQPATVSDEPNLSKQFEYLEIKVAGVTFKNDKGPSRQTLLKKIKQRSAPFDEYLEISINQYDFEGELAYSICVNDRQIGNVPKSQVQYLHDNIERFEAITGINVYGGYRDEDGYFKSYGASITLKLRNS